MVTGDARRSTATPPRRCLDPLQGHRRGDCRLRRLFPRRAARPAPAPARGDAVGPLAAERAADLGAAPRAAAPLGRHAAGGVPGPPDAQHGHRVAGRDDRAAVPDQLQRGARRAPRSCGASAMSPTRFDSLERLFAFVVSVALVAPVVSSFLDAAVVSSFSTESYWEVWRARTFANVLTAVTVVPAVTSVAGYLVSRRAVATGAAHARVDRARGRIADHVVRHSVRRSEIHLHPGRGPCAPGLPAAVHRLGGGAVRDDRRQRDRPDDDAPRHRLGRARQQPVLLTLARRDPDRRPVPHPRGGAASPRAGGGD